MKTEKSILIAFILNLAFSVFEFVGGVFTGSIAIVSDAIHDIGDAAAIGLSFFLERKSKREPDKVYTYGYTRYSVLAGFITTAILLVGSFAVAFNSAERIIHPKTINYNGMIFFALVGTTVNLAAAFVTRTGGSAGEKAVNLHMLEDVLGWVVVLIGAVIMKFTDLAFIDPLLSLAVAVFIIVNAVRNLGEISDIFLEKMPRGIDIDEIKKHLSEIDGIIDVHHIHIRSLDGQRNYATMHLVISGDSHTIKENVRKELREHGITHATLETETEAEACHEKHCHIDFECIPHLGHHHHHQH